MTHAITTTKSGFHLRIFVLGGGGAPRAGAEL